MSLQNVLKQMKLTYIEAFKKRKTLLEQLLEEEDHSKLETFFHQLKGSGATYGFPEITDFGKAYEEKIKNKGLASICKSSCIKQYQDLSEKLTL